MIHFQLLCAAEDIARARSTCPDIAGRMNFPTDDTTVGGGERFAFVYDDDRTAFALLSHAWPYKQNNVFVRSLAGATAAALRRVIAELRTFLDGTADVCPGLLLNAASVVIPPEGHTVCDVFRWFEHQSAAGADYSRSSPR